MTKTFIISDTHFFHQNILNFKKEDGSPLREFSTISDMNETIVSNWNETVRSEDNIFHLGDVCFGHKENLDILNRLNGKKTLLLGNHEHKNIKEYIPYFYDIRAYHVLNKCILSHIPVHDTQLERFKCNIHGHTHWNELKDKRYKNVCVEKTNFRPIDIEEIYAFANGL